MYETDDNESIGVVRATTRNTMVTLTSEYRYHDPETISVTAEDNVGEDGHELESHDPDLVTWNGDEDPGNPRNWPRWRKNIASTVVAMLSLAGPIASSIPSPVVPQILSYYHNGNHAVGVLMVSIVVLAWGFFGLLMGPLSEVFGRHRVMVVSITGSAAFNLACAWSPSMATMLVFRFLEGVFSCAPQVVGAGVLADVFEDRDRIWPLAWYGLAASLGPVVAPIVAGFIAQYSDWRWVFWAATIYHGGVGLAVLVLYEETYSPYLLHRKCKRLISETGNKGLHTIWDEAAESFVSRLRKALLRPVLFLFTNPVIFGLGLFMAFMYAQLYILLVCYPALWKTYYGYTPSIGGLMYIGLAVGILLGVVLWTPIMLRHMVRRSDQGRGKPEDKLYFLPCAAFEMTVALFWYGWSAESRIHWIMPVIGVALFGGGVFVVFQAVQSYVVELNPRLAGSALSALVLGRCILGGTFPLFGQAMYDRLGYGWANTLMGLLMLVLGVPFPVFLYLKGPRMREWVNQHQLFVS